MVPLFVLLDLTHSFLNEGVVLCKTEVTRKVSANFTGLLGWSIQ
jgi:hypothetical protein